MNGIHDLGGMDGFTLPERDPDEPVFRAEWEELVFAVVMALERPWPLDEMRFVMESMPPELYLRAPYFGRWLWSTEKLLVKYGLASEEELGNPDGPVSPAPRVEQPARADVDQTVAPKFRVGDEVIVRNEHPPGHTRVPRYVRGRRGTVVLDHGVYDLPDRIAHGLAPKPQHCYAVMFAASELWGSRGHPKDRTYADLFDDYLETA